VYCRKNNVLVACVTTHQSTWICYYWSWINRKTRNFISACWSL